MGVAGGLAGPDAGRVDLALKGRVEAAVEVELQLPVDVLEQAAHPADHHVAGPELGLGMPRLEDPGRHLADTIWARWLIPYVGYPRRSTDDVLSPGRSVHLVRLGHIRRYRDWRIANTPKATNPSAAAVSRNLPNGCARIVCIAPWAPPTPMRISPAGSCRTAGWPVFSAPRRCRRSCCPTLSLIHI